MCICSMPVNKQGAAGEHCSPAAHVTIRNTITQSIPPKLVLRNVLMDPKERSQCFSQRKTHDGGGGEGWKKNTHKLRKKTELSPQDCLEIHPEMAGTGETLESGGFTKRTEGTPSPPASHGLLHYVCRGAHAQTSCCGYKHLTEKRAGRKKEGPCGPGCSMCHRVSWEGGGVSNPRGPGQLPGSSSLPSTAAAAQPLSPHLMTPFAGQGLTAASLLGACAPNSCRHRNAMFDVHLLLRGPGFFWDLRRVKGAGDIS